MLACGEHLDWGYPDQAPLIALVAWFSRHFIGESLGAIRFLPCTGRRGEGVPHRADRHRAGRRRVRRGTGLSLCPGRSRLLESGHAPYHERFRAAVLDGQRVSRFTGHPPQPAGALAVGGRDCGPGPGKQALHGVHPGRARRRPAAVAASKRPALALVLGRHGHRVLCSRCRTWSGNTGTTGRHWSCFRLSGARRRTSNSDRWHFSDNRY